MTASDLHQRMLHLLDRAKTISARDTGERMSKPAPVLTSPLSGDENRYSSGQASEPVPMDAPAHHGSPGGHVAEAPGITIPELGTAAAATGTLDQTFASAGDLEKPLKDDSNQRGEARQKILRRGKITYQNGNFELECQVRDLNTSGAKLRLAGDVTTPSCFKLVILPEKITKMAQVCWRDDLTLGVRFMED